MKKLALVALGIIALAGCGSLVTQVKKVEPFVLQVASATTRDYCGKMDLSADEKALALATLARMSAYGPELIKTDKAKEFVGSGPVDIVWYGYQVGVSLLDKNIPKDNDTINVCADILRASIDGCIIGLKASIATPTATKN
jgi:hypothetical protein